MSHFGDHLLVTTPHIPYPGLHLQTFLQPSFPVFPPSPADVRVSSLELQYLQGKLSGSALKPDHHGVRRKCDFGGTGSDFRSAAIVGGGIGSRSAGSPAEGTRPESAGDAAGGTHNKSPSSAIMGGRRESPALPGVPAPRPQHAHIASRFSVQDILSPGFGRRAVEKSRGKVKEVGGRREAATPPQPGNLRDTVTKPFIPSPPLPKEQKDRTERPAIPALRQDPPTEAAGRGAPGRERAQGPQASQSPGSQAAETGVLQEGRLPAWVYCTRYSDRPSAGPRSRKKSTKKSKADPEQKRPRTAFNREQLDVLRREFEDNKYLSEERRKRLANQLGLNESQIKIWFQNKRAKVKKGSSGSSDRLALDLMAQGLYNHSTVPESPSSEQDRDNEDTEGSAES